MKIKNMIKKWLFKDELEVLHKIQNDYEKLKNDYTFITDTTFNSVNMFNEAKIEMKNTTKIVEECRKTMNAICDVGVDVGFHDNYHNWAVVCIHGKREFVKFVPLTQKDIMYVASFLKQFEYSKRRIDSPFGYTEMIEDCILKI